MSKIREAQAAREAAGCYRGVLLDEVKNSRPKDLRIRDIDFAIAGGKLYFSRHLCEEFMIEARQYPGARHDDALDALAGALELAATGGSTAAMTVKKRDSVGGAAGF